MVASEQSKADAFISLTGAGRPIDVILLEQLEAQLPASLLEETKAILEQLKQGKPVKTVSPELQSLFRSSVQPYLISWLTYDPVERLQQLNMPVFLVNGGRDIRVPASDAELLHGAKKDAELLIVEMMNHVLKEAPVEQEGNMATYTNPELPLAKGLVAGISSFLKEQDLLQ